MVCCRVKHACQKQSKYKVAFRRGRRAEELAYCDLQVLRLSKIAKTAFSPKVSTQNLKETWLLFLCPAVKLRIFVYDKKARKSSEGFKTFKAAERYLQSEFSKGKDLSKLRGIDRASGTYQLFSMQKPGLAKLIPFRMTSGQLYC